MESINVHLEIREFTAFKFVWLRRFLWIERTILAIVLTIEISILHGMGCILLLSYVQTDAATPNNFGTCSASLKDTTHKTLENMVNSRTWPQNCWKSWANGSNAVTLRFGEQRTKEISGVVGSNVWPVSNFAQKFAKTGCNRVWKRTRHATSNDLGSSWPPVASVYTGL